MPRRVTIDGNEAAAYVAYRTNEVIAIYPITPSSPMGEFADAWAAAGVKNLWGTVPQVQEMQSEGGAAGAIHGALQGGALATTFTASQGLLLMIPNMYKIAGELTPTVFHIAARAIATQGLSIFGDHSDVMAARQTGWAMLFSSNVQEVMDLALVAQAATLKARVPFVHAFDGFRTSHEVQKIELLPDETIRAMIDDELVRAHRERSLSPDRPVMRGTAQNPDVYFQAREVSNPFYLATPGIVQECMDQLAQLTGRHYHLFDYSGAPDAERIIILMGSGAETVEETVKYLTARGEKVGLIKVRLFRPFSAEALLKAIPATVKAIAVLDRTKEPGSAGEPLYQDVLTALSDAVMSGARASLPRVVGGRYGLGSKEFTPAMVKAVFDELKKDAPKNHFTVGIIDDLTNTHLEYDPSFSTEADDVFRAMFWGLGSDGTVGANKNTIKIIGEETDFYAQGYFVYDSKKSGGITISHLRFGPRPIQSTYLIQKANFVAIHQFVFVEKYPVLDAAMPGATVLLNSPYPADEVWNHLPRTFQKQVIEKGLKLYAIDADAVARETGMGRRINTIMQTCFFAISGVLPREEAIAKIKKAIEKTYTAKGEAVVKKNFAAVDTAVAHLHEVKIGEVTSTIDLRPPVPAEAPEFVQKVTAEMIANRGDNLPTSLLPADGTYPTATTQWEKRSIGLEVPVWDPDLCIQCGKCVMVCPHAVIRAKVADEAALAGAPEGFKHMPARFRELPGKRYTIQVSTEDCTGCALCVEACPAKSKQDPSHKAINMTDIIAAREQTKGHWDFFLSLPDVDATAIPFNNVRNVQLARPLFEFSGACAGCGETPYLKLISQLFGDHMLIANATGCSSIYGGNLPTTPWAKDAAGRGPAWSNSLFEDNAEFGLGMRLAVDKQTGIAMELVEALRDQIGADLADALLTADQSDVAGIAAQRERVAQLKERLEKLNDPRAAQLAAVADYLVKKSVWIIGGDGWAYDIGFGGLDHVIASGKNVNILVLDTEVYSNTGGQASKSTPRGAVAKFAAGGKPAGKKDLGAIAMQYGNVYVAQVALGYNDAQVLRAFREAESYDGPSLIIAYSHCIAHGIDMAKGLNQQKLAVESGHWPVYRYDPRLAAEGKNPFQLDCPAPKVPLEQYVYNETRYAQLRKSNPAAAEELLRQGQADVEARWRRYEQLAKMEVASAD
ncbi:pyruvate:ferredoxin (flavodoxin) oxidoreductase [Symbiobacterium terraclitae]|uniref:pyruvate:ferredoxin (flavodoxin) oxidoreductase n=1 Tax=Symbiobacterium terraclitae TaxID=557451 RepID=UPI0035B554E2